MSKIEIISASAGSGKTHTLATLLEKEIDEGRVRPDAVLATTFTNKAAAELKERTRRTLLAAGRFDDAQRLGAARIGTVNAVCGRIVADFSFELGLSPDVRVLDEAVSASSFREALSSVLSDTVTGTFEDLRSRMREFDGLAAVRSVLDAARSNGLGTIELSACADRSVAGVLELFGTPVAGENLDGALVEALTTFVASVDTTVDTTKKTATALETAGSALADLRRGRHLLWSEWAKLAKLAPAQKSDALADPVRAAAAAQDRHPRLRADMETAIRTVFSVAGQALDVYQAHKRAWGVIDFADQEVLALGLLGRADVRAHLAGELDLVLVDEFQDTSPVQLAIFLRLSELAVRSVWVGDQKQAIFGFRGADPSLMDAVIRAILGETEPRTLPHSYRSRPELVRLTSDLFARAFPSQGIPAERVRLEPARLDEAPGLGVILERWTLDAKSTENDAHAVAAGVRQLLDDPTTRVREGKADARAVRAGDVAVLCRTNDGCAAVADALENLGIRAALPRARLLSTPEAIATTAALRLFVDGRDSLAKAELSRFAEGDGDLDAWLARLLETPGAGALTKLDVVQRVLAARERSPGAGALEAFDLAVDAARVAELCRRWGDAEARLANLDRLRAHAVTYLSGASATGAAATPAGLIAWLGRLADDGEDAQAVRTGGGAVAVSTWHAAKGLEWPIVVLHGLNRFTGSPLGVSVARDIDGFDFAAPLAGRWVRFWPQPYAAKNNGLPFHTRLAAHPATVEAEAREARQELRVLYVGWTRARDRLVISTRAGALTKGLLELLQEGGVPLVNEPTPSATWAGRVVTATLTYRISVLEDAVERHRQGFGGELRGLRGELRAVGHHLTTLMSVLFELVLEKLGVDLQPTFAERLRSKK